MRENQAGFESDKTTLVLAVQRGAGWHWGEKCGEKNQRGGF